MLNYLEIAEKAPIKKKSYMDIALSTPPKKKSYLDIAKEAPVKQTQTEISPYDIKGYGIHRQRWYSYRTLRRVSEP